MLEDVRVLLSLSGTHDLGQLQNCSASFFLQETTLYIGKHRSAVIRAPRGAADVLVAVGALIQQVTRVMSFSAESITGALSDRMPILQPGTEWKRPFKSSLGRA